MKSLLSLVILFFATSTVAAHPHAHFKKCNEGVCKKDCKDCDKCVKCKDCKKDCKNCKCKDCDCDGCKGKLKSVAAKPFKLAKKVLKSLKD